MGSPVPKAESNLLAEPITIVAHKLYALGACAPLDGRVSWAPHLDGRHQAISCYLLKEDDEALLIDTGVPAHASVVLQQLERLVSPGSPLRVFLTRPELDAVANLSSIREIYEVRYVMAGGSINPFDGFDDATSTRRASGLLSVVRTSGLDLAQGRQIRIIVPLLRFLPSYWPFDVQTRTLFTSDIFGHTDQAGAMAPEVISSLSHDVTTRESVAEHLFCKFWWLPGSKTQQIMDDLTSIFSTLDPEIVAPGHGCVLKGKDVVQRHLNLLLEVLERC
jgi:flavorubredoxin